MHCSSGPLADALARYTHPYVLVVDEVGYLTYGTDAANMLFHVVNDRHRRKRSMVFTTNKPLGSWGKVLHDEDLAQAIVDRVLERGRLFTLDGPSMRTRHLGLDESPPAEASTQLARISGIPRPEFPEPTLPVALGSGGIDKRKQGDAKLPLGEYGLGEPRPSRKFHTFIPVGYPTAAQVRQGYTGGDVGVHGPPRLAHGPLTTAIDWTLGCVAVGTDDEIDRIARWVRTKKVNRVVIKAK